MEIGKYHTKGYITKRFIESLTPLKGNDLLNLTNEVGTLENFDKIIDDNLFQIKGNNANLIKFEKNKIKVREDIYNDICSYFEDYLAKYESLLNSGVHRPQDNLNTLLEEYFFEPVARNIIMKIGNKYLKGKIFKNSNMDFKEQLKEYLFELLEEEAENFNFLNIPETERGNYEDCNERRAAYNCFTEKKPHDKSIYNFGETIEKVAKGNKITLTEDQRGEIILALWILRFYNNFSDLEIVEEKKSIGSYFHDLSTKINDPSVLDDKLKKHLELLGHFSKLVTDCMKDSSKSELIHSSNPESELTKHNLKYLSDIQMVKYLVSIGKEEKSLDIIENSLKEALYRSKKEDLDWIIKAGMLLSISLKKPKKLKSFYKYAEFFNFEHGNAKDNINWKSQYYLDQYLSFFGVECPSLKNGDLVEHFKIFDMEDYQVKIKSRTSKKELYQKLMMLCLAPPIPNYSEYLESNPNKSETDYLNKFKDFGVIDLNYHSRLADDVIRLIKAGADMAKPNSKNQTPLTETIASKNYDVVLKLLEYPEISKTINIRTYKTNATCLSLLLSNLFDPMNNSTLKKEKTLIILEKLLKMGADPNLTCDLGKISPLYLLLTLLNTRNRQGIKGYHELSPEEKKQFERQLYGDPMLKFMKNNSQNSEFIKKSQEFYKAYSELNDSIKLTLYSTKAIELLLKYDADPNRVIFKGFTSLLFSVEIGCLDIFKLLSSYNDSYHLLERNGNNILVVAARWESYDILEYILTDKKEGISKGMLDKLYTFYSLFKAEVILEKIIKIYSKAELEDTQWSQAV